ncbi:MAG: glutathione synthase [Gammaproteobacteria bacterium]|nr:glutathione synthase [Gammaproteobacteria bacterium]
MSSTAIRKIAVLMDPISTIKPAKDTTLAMMLAAQSRGWKLYYLQQSDLSLYAGKVMALLTEIRVMDDESHWYEFGDSQHLPLADMDVLLMRKDPPFDMEYIYSTYLLEQAETEGLLVVNKPQSLRDANEKLYTAWFPHCTPPTLVSRRAEQFREFLAQHKDVILKPLEGMGGTSIFRLTQSDPNISVVIETLTEYGNRYAMAQAFIPEISNGDKRIILIDGEPIPYALARIPAKGETRGNLAAGGTGVGQELSERDYWLCEQVAPTLREKGLIFVGLDVIGDYLTEINVTSPTGVRELDRTFGLTICDKLMDAIEKRLSDEK